MSDDRPGEMPEDAPELGEATDVRIGDETAVLLMRGGKLVEREPPPRKQPQSTETPDDLGGTGGEQPGGAG